MHSCLKRHPLQLPINYRVEDVRLVVCLKELNGLLLWCWKLELVAMLFFTTLGVGLLDVKVSYFPQRPP